MYVEPSNRIRKILRIAVNSNGGVAKFSKIINTSENNIRRWLRGDRSIPFGIIKYLANLNNADIWQFLVNENLKSMTSNNSFKIFHEIKKAECILLGWVLSEGHLSNERLTITQKEKQPLNVLRNLISRHFYFKNSIRIEQDRNAWRLVINSCSFAEYLNSRYTIPFGKKAKIIRVPIQIFTLPKEEKFAFLAGCFEGDGSFIASIRASKRGKYKIPVATLTSSSKDFLEDTKKILSSLDIKPRIHSDKIAIYNSKDCVKLFFYLLPYMVSENKIKDFVYSLSDFQFLNSVSIANCGDLITKWKNKLNITWNKFTEFIEEKCKYKASYYTVSNWGYNYFSPPLSVVLAACEELKENYFDYIPKWFAGLFWIHKKISKADFERLREMKL